jgi:RNA-directed DNA polymerase
MTGSTDKPFNISRQLVWEAFKRVKANKGAAGVDGVSIEEFEKDLKNQLYKIWNRLSSGTYFPPPVRAVESSYSGGQGGALIVAGFQGVAGVRAGGIQGPVVKSWWRASYRFRPQLAAVDR